jgi:hypothetical protein
MSWWNRTEEDCKGRRNIDQRKRKSIGKRRNRRER